MPAPTIFLAVLLCFSAPVGAENAGKQARIQQLQAELSRRTSDASLHSELAALFVETGQFEAAVKAAERGLGVAPGNQELTLSLCAGLIASGRASEAVRMLQSLPRTGKSRFLLGMAHRTLGEHERARSALLEAWELGRRDPYLLYTIIEQDRALGDKKSGLEHFTLFWKEFPNSPWLHLLLADAHLAVNEEAAAQIEYQKALDRQPSIPLANFHLGVLRFQAGDSSAAAVHFRREIEINPQLAEPYAYLGHILRAQRKVREAISVLSEAVRRDAKSAFALRELAVAQTEDGQLTNALATLKAARRQFPEEASFAAQLATLLRRLGRSAEAKIEAEHAAALMKRKLDQRQHEISRGQQP